MPGDDAKRPDSAVLASDSRRPKPATHRTPAYTRRRARLAYASACQRDRLAERKAFRRGTALCGLRVMRDGHIALLPPRGSHVEFTHGSPGILLGLSAAAPVAAQDSTTAFCRADGRPPSSRAEAPARSHSSRAARSADFPNNIGFGYGLNGAYLLRLDHAGHVRLRADAGFVDYGNESFHAPLSTTVGGRVQVKVSTNNYIVPLSIGPQLAMPTGLIRPYVNGGIAAQIFFTESGVEGSDDSYDFANTTNQYDWTSTWVAGGGVYVPIYTQENVGADRRGHSVFRRGTREIPAPRAAFRICRTRRFGSRRWRARRGLRWSTSE